MASASLGSAYTHSLLKSKGSSLPLFQQKNNKSIQPRGRNIRLTKTNLFVNARPNKTVKAVNQDPGYTGPVNYVPEANFYKVEAIVRPWSVSHVASGLLKAGIRGVTVSDVRGFGAQGASPERQWGSEFTEDNFVSKVKMEIVVCKEQVETVIDAIIEEARTGEIGDGKIFVIPVADVIRVRTGERGPRAERMIGGRAEMFFKSSSSYR